MDARGSDFPDRKDFAAIIQRHGAPSPNASDEEISHFIRLAQAHKIIRVIELVEDNPLPSPRNVD